MLRNYLRLWDFFLQVLPPLFQQIDKRENNQLKTFDYLSRCETVIICSEILFVFLKWHSTPKISRIEIN